MNVGTKSILFGVHQFLWHPITVLLAWRKLYKHWPHWSVFISILCHDIGYWGCSNIDGPEGKRHPQRGAFLAARLVCLLAYRRWLSRIPQPGEYGSGTYYFTLLHSRDMAKAEGAEVSPLYAADKASVLFDPRWFYLLRAKLSGELDEYQRNSALPAGTTAEQWFDWYREKIRTRPGVKELL